MHEKAEKNVFAFVMERREETGGFGATPKLPATVEDTCNALRILELVRAKTGRAIRNIYDPLTDSRLRSYLKNLLADLPPDLRNIYQVARSAKMTGTGMDHEAILNHVVSRLNRSSRLHDWYYALKITREILGIHPEQVLDLSRIPLRRAGFFSGIARQRWMATYIDSMTGPGHPGTENRARWFAACQNSDGGFGFMPGTTSYIENCHYALRALALLGHRPLNAEAAHRFIMGCRTISGGFSRNGNAAPFLDATRHAVASLCLLEYPG